MKFRRTNISWVTEHKRIWRAAVLWLLVVAILGPWAYDRIHVPVEFSCSFPNFRLEGDSCGVPLSGPWVLGTILSELVNQVEKVRIGITTIVELITTFRSYLGAPLLVLPFFTTLLLVLAGNRHALQMLNVVTLGIAAALGLLIGLSGYPQPTWALWGIWLHFGVAISALLLEVLTLESRKRAMAG